MSERIPSEAFYREVPRLCKEPLSWDKKAGRTVLMKGDRIKCNVINTPNWVLVYRNQLYKRHLVNNWGNLNMD